MTMRSLAAVFLLVLMSSLQAGVEVHEFSQPELAQRYKVLINELRCLVCQNQNLADSNAELAQDLRNQVYVMIQRGDSNEAIAEYMVARYGDFVLYRPPVKRSTLFLWLGPFIFLIAGIVVLVVVIRRRGRASGIALSEEQQHQARKLLNEQEGDASS